jgi:hypothetical protein
LCRRWSLAQAVKWDWEPEGDRQFGLPALLGRGDEAQDGVGCLHRAGLERLSPRGFQDVVGSAQFAILPLQLGDPLGVGAGRASLAARSISACLSQLRNDSVPMPSWRPTRVTTPKVCRAGIAPWANAHRPLR